METTKKERQTSTKKRVFAVVGLLGLAIEITAYTFPKFPAVLPVSLMVVGMLLMCVGVAGFILTPSIRRLRREQSEAAYEERLDDDIDKL